VFATADDRFEILKTEHAKPRDKRDRRGNSKIILILKELDMKYQSNAKEKIKISVKLDMIY